MTAIEQWRQSCDELPYMAGALGEKAFGYKVAV
jgi:hypothetical protein